jgi:hypothetical protein
MIELVALRAEGNFDGLDAQAALIFNTVTEHPRRLRGRCPSTDRNLETFHERVSFQGNKR